MIFFYRKESPVSEIKAGERRSSGEKSGNGEEDKEETEIRRGERREPMNPPIPTMIHSSIFSLLLLFLSCYYTALFSCCEFFFSSVSHLSALFSYSGTTASQFVPFGTVCCCPAGYQDKISFPREHKKRTGIHKELHRPFFVFVKCCISSRCMQIYQPQIMPVFFGHQIWFATSKASQIAYMILDTFFASPSR